MTPIKNLLLLFSLNLVSQSFAQEIILSETFNTGIPANWSIINGDTHTVNPSVSEFQPAWISLVDPLDPEAKIVGSTSYFEPEAKAYRFLVTPQITLGDYGNFLYWRSRSHDPSFPDWIMVLVSTTGNNINDFTDTLFRLNNEFPEWTSRSINLSAEGYNSTNVYLAFVNHTNQGYKLYLDDIVIEKNDPVSLEPQTLPSVTLFPNPSASNFIQIQCAEMITNLAIVDATGRTIKELQNPELHINVADLPKGMYFVRVNTVSGVQVHRYQKL